jgi:TPR repeat protein
MDPGARRRACEEFRAKLRRDTGTDLPSAFCQVILETCFQGKRGEQVSLESDPGLFYASLGAAISAGNLVIANHVKVAVWCWRQAAEVHNDPVAMTELAGFYYEGEGVAEDRAQAVYWYQKAADLGDAAAKATLGTALVYGDPPWVAKDAVRGLGLLREAVELGYGAALYLCVLCYLKGMGVEKDAAHAVALLLKAATQDPASTDPDATAAAQLELAHCYKDGNGVEADTVQVRCLHSSTSQISLSCLYPSKRTIQNAAPLNTPQTTPEIPRTSP